MRAAVALLVVLLGGCPRNAAPVDMTVPPDLAQAVYQCAETIDAYCAQTACIGDLPTAEQAMAWCGADGFRPRALLIRYTCGEYVVIGAYYIDTGDQYVYDATTGKLVAVVSTVNVDTGCAGPPTLAIPPCTASQTLCERPLPP